MPRYIDKDMLLHKMKQRHEDLARNYCKYDNYVIGFSEAIRLLENAPVADIREELNKILKEYEREASEDNPFFVKVDIGDIKSL